MMAYSPKPGINHCDEVYLYNRFSLVNFIFENVLKNTDSIKQFNFDLPFVEDKNYWIEYVVANTFSKRHAQSINLFAQSPGYFIETLVEKIADTASSPELIGREEDFDGKQRTSLVDYLKRDLKFDDYYELDPEMMIRAYFSGMGRVSIAKQDTDLLLLCRNNTNNQYGEKVKLLVIEAKPFIINIGEKKEEEDNAFLKQICAQLRCVSSLAFKYQMHAQGIAILYDTETFNPRGIVLGMEYSPSDSDGDLLVYDENLRIMKPNKYLRKSGVINVLPRGCEFFD